MAARTFTDRAEETGRRLVREDRYVLVLMLILATILSTAFLGDGTIGTLIPLAIMSVTMAVTLSTSDAGPKVVLISRVAVLLAFIGVVVAGLIGFDALARLGYFMMMIVLSVFTPLVIARRLTSTLR